MKVSLATTLNRSKGGQFAVHAKALLGCPYDGHTLATVIPEIENSIGVELKKIVADAGYRGHNAPKDKGFKVYVAGMRRGLTDAVKRAFRRRAAVEPVIGNCKSDHRMGRNFLPHAAGDAANPVLAAAGYNSHGHFRVKGFRAFTASSLNSNDCIGLLTGVGLAAR